MQETFEATAGAVSYEDVHSGQTFASIPDGEVVGGTSDYQPFFDHIWTIPLQKGAAQDASYTVTWRLSSNVFKLAPNKRLYSPAFYFRRHYWCDGRARSCRSVGLSVCAFENALSISFLMLVPRCGCRRLFVYPRGNGNPSFISAYIENVSVRRNKSSFCVRRVDFTVLNQLEAPKSVSRRTWHPLS